MKPTSIDEDIVTTQLEEAGDVLEHEGERVGLPVVGVIGELDGPLDVCWIPLLSASCSLFHGQPFRPTTPDFLSPG